jgi:very-short-patch-repair endonuclease
LNEEQRHLATNEAQVRTVADLIKRKLDEARDTLIERNLRNKLVNCALASKRSRQIRVVDEVADEVFRALLGPKREFVFGAARSASEEANEDTDADLVGWTPPVDDQELEDGVARRHRDNVLQTQLTAEGLQKRLTSLYYEAREVEEEQGVNVLYLVLGFLKWFESGTSEVERFAPLILLPVELTREGARDRFKLKIRDEDLYTNVSLRAWLAEQHSIQLPELPDSDEWLPSHYFELVRTAIEDSPRWEVLDNEILLGFFSFNKYLLWRDLDPKNWPSPEALLRHKVLRSLLAPAEESPMPDPPVIPKDARIDDLVKLSELIYVLDADSSQTAAIQTALAGRNLVIQGPPGTGKSQTIANIIASAIAKGRSVLFVAEKMAALQVVFERLKGVGLGHLCLELHSRKASKQQVLGQLRQAIDAPTPPKVPGDLGTSLDGCAHALWTHSDRLHKPTGAAGYTPFEVIGRICRLKDRGVAVPDFRIDDAHLASRRAVETLLTDCDTLAKQLELSGVPARHPWRDCERDPLNPLDQQRLGGLIQRLLASLEALKVVMRSVWPIVRPTDASELSGLRFNQLEQVEQALALAGSRPGEPVEVLCNPRWASDLLELDSLLANARKLADLEAKLDSTFLSSAWTADWTKVRTEVVGCGRSLFRIFRSAYRDAMRTFRGHCKAFPDGFEDRVHALDALVEGISLRKTFEQQRTRLHHDIGPLFEALPKEWERLDALIKWLRQASALEPALSVRSNRLLNWSDTPAAWAERLRTVSDKVVESLFQVAALVQLTETGLSTAARQIDWTLGGLARRARDWSLSVERYNEWPPVRDGIRKLRSCTEESFAARCYSGAVSLQELQDRVHLAVFEQIWQVMTTEDPGLAKTDGRLLTDTVHRFRELDRKRIQAAADEVSKEHHDQKPTGTIGDMGVIRAELNKSRRHLPVRKLLDVAGHAVQQLKPAFLMSPLSVAQYLTPGRLKFDLLLIDEASQVRPADALGAVARTNQAVVVGDAKQLPPTNFFNRLVADDDESVTAGQSDDGYDLSASLGAMESILSLCDSAFTSRELLAWHYRSQHPGLIAVSNRNFYDNKLLLPPSVLVEKAGDGLGVVFHQTPSGGYDRGRSSTNVLEADIVAEAVCQFARTWPDKSLGVGTFSVAQRDVIRARIDARRRETPELEPFFSTNRAAPFFVKNLESIQGDERDVIFISVGYGRDRDGRLTQSFGPINSEGGERRLNVLISRARERCEVFSPITADDIDVSNRKPGTLALREFLQYAQKGYFDVPQSTDRTFDSDFEESVADFLKSRGMVVHPQVGMAGFYIDLGVIDPTRPSRYLLGVECDGATYHSSRSARDRDRIRQEILESRGWTIHRVWSTDWFHRRAQEQMRLLDAIEKAARKGEHGPKRPAEPAPPEPRPVGLPSDLRAPGRAPAYVEADFRVGTSLAPHEAPDSTVADAMLRILQIEAPIHEDEACRRLATVWDLERAGSRIREAGLKALRRLAAKGGCVGRDRFWMVSAEQPVVVRDRSATISATLRRADYLPPMEILAAATQIIDDSARAHMDELLVEVARRLGFQRTGQELQQVIRCVVEAAVGTRFLCDSEGLLTLGGAAS